MCVCLFKHYCDWCEKMGGVGGGSIGKGALVGGDRDSDRSCGHEDEGEENELASTVVWTQERGIVTIGV